MSRKLIAFGVLVLCFISAASVAASGPEDPAIRKLETSVDQALLEGNANALDSIMAEGFACKTGDAGFISKAALLEYLKANGSAWQSIADQDINTFVYDGDTVIVTGISVRRYKGTNDLLKLRFTRVYSKITDRWQLAAMHAEQVL
jgi:Domain of unknown function (DUF4440)